MPRRNTVNMSHDQWSLDRKQAPVVIILVFTVTKLCLQHMFSTECFAEKDTSDEQEKLGTGEAAGAERW